MVHRALLALLTVAVAAMALLAGVEAWWRGFVGAAFAAGLLLAMLWQRGGVSTRQVLVGAVVFRLFFFWLAPGLSEDGYRYVWDGLVQQEGINPYRYAPEDPALTLLQQEPVFGELNSAEFYSVYPPVSQLVFAVGGLAYNAGWEVSYYIIKAIFVLLELAGVFLLSRMVEARALMLYAWHPLVLIETAGQGHTEAALVLFLMMSVWLARQGRGGWASVCLALAAWTKLYPLVLFPFLGRRFGWRGLWPGALTLALVALPYAAPYVPAHVRSSLDLYVRLFEFNAGLYLGVKQLLLEWTGEDWSKTLGPLFRTLFLLTLPMLYGLDWRRQWPLSKAFLVTIGAFLVLSTTVHPWYLLGILPLAALRPAPAWHWQWLGLVSLGTYLLYVEGPYWPFVIAGWGGWGVLALWGNGDALLQRVQRLRARAKARCIEPFLPEETRPLKVLDLGAGEGYVGAELADKHGAEVTLADVVDLNRTALPHLCYDGRHLPFDDNRFDVTVLYFVLHHSEDAEQVLREALRVSRQRVVVVESVCETEGQRRLLRGLDQWANRLRSGGRMDAQEEHLHFRTAAAWRQMFERLSAEIVAEKRWGRWVHRQALFVLAPD